jgi:predicted nucleic acid-binding protein
MAVRARERGIVYLDSSAIVKTVIVERESAALRRFLRRHPLRVSCALARTEVGGAVRHLGPKARQVVQRIDLVRLDDALLDAASALDAAVLRSLDATHLAAALTVAAQLEAIVTYDARMAESAALLGLPVAVPA